MATVFTFPGKMGDALLEWPVAYWYGRQVGDFEVWMDEKTCKPLVPLFEAQPHVTKVKLIPGIEHWNCGGQPFHFELPTSAFEGNTVFHLGLRNFPQRQISLETLHGSKTPVQVDPAEFANTPSISVGLETPEKRNRLVVHGQGMCPHNRQTPHVWKFISGIHSELAELFDEIVFVGDARDLEVAATTYPGCSTFDDKGDFLALARLIAGSRAMIGAGTSPITLAGCLKIPAIRVHDAVGADLPKVIWSNLGENQLNDTELGLRKSWPGWRDQWLRATVSS